jgi:hypothetical protein
MRANHHQPALPLLPDQILGKCVCEHRARRRDVNHIGPAILLAQAIVGCSRVEQHHSAIADCVGGLDQSLSGQIGDDKGDVLIGQCSHCFYRIVGLLESHLMKREMLIEEFARRVVVVDRKARTGDAVVCRRLFDQRKRRLDGGPAEKADADFSGIGGKDNERRVQDEEETHQ